MYGSFLNLTGGRKSDISDPAPVMHTIIRIMKAKWQSMRYPNSKVDRIAPALPMMSMYPKLVALRIID